MMRRRFRLPIKFQYQINLVEMRGLEPPTSTMSMLRSNQLSYISRWN